MLPSQREERVTIPLTEVRGFYRMRERTDMPTSYSAGTGVDRLRHPWDSRSWLRDSTKIRLATFRVLRRGRFRLQLHTPRIFKERPETVYPVGAFGQTHPIKGWRELL
jgi:hypothetical protein